MSSVSGARALYVHMPFCAQKCAYCDFTSWATRPDEPLMAGYVDAIISQIDAFAEAGLLDGLETAYIGGGTPSLAGGSLPRLVRRMAALGPEELSSEANPDSLTPELIDQLAAAGLTRLSLGVQSTNDQELAALGRIHDSARALDALRESVAAGLDTSCDLMCAIPLQTDETWQKSIEDVVSTGISHVSVYPLAIEEGTTFGRRYGDDDPAWNDPDIQASRMEIAAAYLAGQGFHRYEVASHARPEHECRHNIAYWTGRPYLGLGTSAAGMLDAASWALMKRVCPQLPELPVGTARIRLTVTSPWRQIVQDPDPASLHFDLEFLDEQQAVAEDLMLGARLTAGIAPELLSRASHLFGSRLDAVLESVTSTGLATFKNGRLAPTHDGWLLGNELYGQLWGLAEGTIQTVAV